LDRLEVETVNDSLAGGPSLVFLYEVDANRVVNQLAFLEDFRKVPLRIRVTNWLKQFDTGDIGLQNSHATPYNTGNGWLFYVPLPKKKSILGAAVVTRVEPLRRLQIWCSGRAPFPGLSVGLLFGNLRCA
jgi:hypothetical protein